MLDGLLVCDATPCHGLVARLAAEQGQLTPGQLNMWLAGLHLHTAAHSSLVTQLLVRLLPCGSSVVPCPDTPKVTSQSDTLSSFLLYFFTGKKAAQGQIS